MTAKTDRDPKPTFTSLRSLRPLQCPPGSTSTLFMHATEAGFAVHVLRPRKDGKVRKTYIYRWSEMVPDPATGKLKKEDHREDLGLVDEIDGIPATPYEDALDKARAFRRSRYAEKADGPKRMTVGDAWSRYAAEKQGNRDTTHEKDARTYRLNLEHLEHRYLDELDRDYWLNAVLQLRAGTYAAGSEIKDGKTVPILRGPLATASLQAVLNLASNLYEIARARRGLPGLEPGENPPRDVKSKAGKPNKRKGYVSLDKLGLVWRATNQLVTPGWRDLFQVFVLTGLRRALALAMKFSDIDFERGLYIIDPRTPGTKRRGSDIPENPEMIRLPLSRQVLGIIKARQEFAPDPQGPVFYSAPVKGKKAEKGTMTDPRAAWSILEEYAGRALSPHDLRRTFATVGSVAVQGDELYALALLMLHSGSTLAEAVGLPDITLDYINTDAAQDAMRNAAEAVSAHVQALVAGKVPAKGKALPKFLEDALAVE